MVARELARYRIDIAALCETRISGRSQFSEEGGGYTFFCIGQPEGAPRQGGVGFAIRNEIVKTLCSIPVAITPRHMSLELPLPHGRKASLLSVYAPTLLASDDCKEEFYAELDNIISKISCRNKLFILGDFNARVGSEFATWSRVLGRHGVGNANSNGTMLLELCAKHELVITNTVFQQANKFKNTWMHPRSKHWHMLDYVITKQRDLKDVKLTRAMRGSTMWSDHVLVRSTVRLTTTSSRRCRRGLNARKLNVSALKRLDVRTELEQEFNARLSERENNDGAEDGWNDLKYIVYNATAKVVGFVRKRSKDWFDDQDTEIRALLNKMHTTHLQWINDKSCTAKKHAYSRARKEANVRLRAMKERWWNNMAIELQTAADRHNMKAFYDGLKAVYGPRDSGSVPVYSKDGSHLITDREKILERWAENFRAVLNQASEFDSTVLSEIPQWDVFNDLAYPPSEREVLDAIQSLKAGKAPGADSLPEEIFKYGGRKLIQCLTTLYQHIWEREEVPQEFKDAQILHIFRRKGDRATCDDHRGISLLSIPVKILARVILNRLALHVSNNNILPES